MNAAKWSGCLALVLAGFACVLGQGLPEKERQALTKPAGQKQDEKDGKGDGDKKRKSGALPLTEAARFRVVVTGFTVNRETRDHLLEADGKGDEVYVLVELAQYDGYTAGRTEGPDFYPGFENHRPAGHVALRRSLASVLMGDVNNLTDPPRVQAGSRSRLGGLRTGDKFPDPEPWAYRGATHEDRLPLLVWEGELRRGRDLLVIVPTVWEWDGGNPELRARFNERAETYFGLDARFGRGFPTVEFTGGDLFSAGDRPVGLLGPHWSPEIIFLNYDLAARAAAGHFGSSGAGVLEVRYRERPGPGEDYTLYLKVERAP